MWVLCVTWTNGRTLYFCDPMWTEVQAKEALIEFNKFVEDNAWRWEFGEQPEAWIDTFHTVNGRLNPHVIPSLVLGGE
jgi:hypothetical protein